MRAMNKSCLNIAGRRRPHHEAAVCCLIQTNTCVRVVHVGDDLLGIKQNNEMLRNEAQTVHNQIFLREPDRSTLGNAESCANNAHIYVREIVWIANRFRPPGARNLGPKP